MTICGDLFLFALDTPSSLKRLVITNMAFIFIEKDYFVWGVFFSASSCWVKDACFFLSARFNVWLTIFIYTSRCPNIVPWQNRQTSCLPRTLISYAPLLITILFHPSYYSVSRKYRYVNVIEITKLTIAKSNVNEASISQEAFANELLTFFIVNKKLCVHYLLAPIFFASSYSVKNFFLNCAENQNWYTTYL